MPCAALCCGVRTPRCCAGIASKFWEPSTGLVYSEAGSFEADNEGLFGLAMEIVFEVEVAACKRIQADLRGY